MDRFEDVFQNNIAEHQRIFAQLHSCYAPLRSVGELILKSFRLSGKLLVCGNGGSAADSQHIAAELVVRFKKERAALPAIALSTDTSILTACANDYDYSEVFARQVKALARKGDVLLGISTSGRSKNVIKAFEAASDLGVRTVAFVGGNPSYVEGLVDYVISVPSNDTARVQEAHSFLFHALCEMIEDMLNDEGL